MCLAVHRGVDSIVLACNPAYSIVFVTDDVAAVLFQAAIQNLISLAKSTASGSSVDPSQETTAVDPLTAVTAPLPPSAPPLTIVSSAEVESGEIVVTSSAAASSSSSSSAAASSSSSVTYLSLLSEEDAVDEAGEKLLLSEIGKFRTRQLQRDKEVEEQRKMKIKAKMMELKVTLPLTPS